MNAILNILEGFNDKKAQSRFDSRDVRNYRMIATIPYLLPILFVLPYLAGKNSEYCRFHANQQLAWFICTLIMAIIGLFVGIVTSAGTIVGWILFVLWLIVSICLMIGAYNDLAVKIPGVGTFAEIF